MQGKRMLDDMEALGQAYLDALSELPPILPARQIDPASASNVQTGCEDMQASCDRAATRLQEGFRALLSVVLLGSQDQKLLQAAP